VSWGRGVKLRLAPLAVGTTSEIFADVDHERREITEVEAFLLVVAEND
jgi:hypothetical protein